MTHLSTQSRLTMTLARRSALDAAAALRHLPEHGECLLVHSMAATLELVGQAAQDLLREAGRWEPGSTDHDEACDRFRSVNADPLPALAAAFEPRHGHGEC